jgi:alpha-tubulin suppressor-like RCC1 family protein
VWYAIATGDDVGTALKSDGTVWDWGLNTYGSLGDGTFVDKHVPVQVKDPSGQSYLTRIVSIADGGNDFTLALKADGTVYAWGFGISGELGNNGSNTIAIFP